jgi:hypothetical protein
VKKPKACDKTAYKLTFKSQVHAAALLTLSNQSVMSAS